MLTADGLHCSYSELKKLLQETLEAPHAVYVPTKLSLSSSKPQGATGSSAAARVTYGKDSGLLGLKIGITDDFTAQELFFLALEKEVARVNTFVLVGHSFILHGLSISTIQFVAKDF